MKKFKMFFVVSIILLIISPVCFARDFGWMKDFNIKAEGDPTGFRAKLRARFKIGDAEIEAVLSDVRNPADVYMVFRLGEMSRRPTKDILNKYSSRKGKGWGNIAKDLGIKPGSQEFHALKEGNFTNIDKGKIENKNRIKKKNKSKSKN